MSLWSAVKAAVYKPVRGIGRIARGHVREGLRDIGQGVKTAAPAIAFIPGVGLPAAAAIGAAGGVLGAKKHAGVGDFVRGGLQGAAAGAAGEGLQGIGKMAMGARGLIGAGEGAVDLANPAATYARNLPNVMGKAPGIGSRILGGVKDFGKWAGPEVIGDIVGTGAQMYGAQQMGQAEDRMAALDEEERRYALAEKERRRQAIGRVLRDRGWA